MAPFGSSPSRGRLKGDEASAALAELKQGQDVMLQLIQSLAGELKDVKQQLAAQSVKDVRQEAVVKVEKSVAEKRAPNVEAKPAQDLPPPSKPGSSDYARLEDDEVGVGAEFAAQGRIFAGNASPGALPISNMLWNAAGSDPIKALATMVVFVCVGYLIYGSHEAPFRLNNYDESEDAGWNWGFVDTFYFTMATLTTIGYGDMPTLPQHMRVITIFYGLIGVLVVAGSIGIVVRREPSLHRA